MEYSARKVLELLEHLRLPPAHFMGVSLGTLVMQHVALLRPDRIRSMVLAGAIVRFQRWGELLVRLSRAFPLKHLLSARAGYILFAHVLMPRRNHRKSRSLFIQVARQLRTSDYHTWVRIAYEPERTYSQLAPRQNTLPKLYVCGSQDYMFLPGLRRFVQKEARAELVILPDCGHVCNIEQASRFNELALAFLQRFSVGPPLAPPVPRLASGEPAQVGPS